MKRISKEFILLLISAVLLAAGPLSGTTGAVRLKELITLEGVRDNQLMGYGLVVGLAGTGDRRQTIFSAQSVANLLERMGLTVDPTTIQVKNTAAVMVRLGITKRSPSAKSSNQRCSGTMRWLAGSNSVMGVFSCGEGH